MKLYSKYSYIARITHNIGENDCSLASYNHKNITIYSYIRAGMGSSYYLNGLAKKGRKTHSCIDIQMLDSSYCVINIKKKTSSTFAPQGNFQLEAREDKIPVSIP